MARINGIATLFYADGTTFKLPGIETSQNGWVYKPDELRTDWERQRGKNKVFSRSDGHGEAERFLENKLMTHLRERKFEKPQAISNPTESVPSQSGISYTIGWKDSTWGWIGISLIVTPSQDRWSHGKAHLKYTVHGHQVAAMLTDKTVTGANDKPSVIRDILKENEKELVPRLVQAWRADPWNETLKAFDADERASQIEPPSLRLARVYQAPSDEIKQVEFNGEKIGSSYDAARSGLGLDDNGFWSTSRGNIEFFEKDVIKTILRDNEKWEVLTELLDALKFCGIQLNVRSDYNYSAPRIDGERQREITGFEITIPKQGETHRHVVKVSSHNMDPKVEVDCGYEDDERLWMERKQRQAVEQMETLEREFGAFEIDLGSEGKNDND